MNFKRTEVQLPTFEKIKIFCLFDASWVATTSEYSFSINHLTKYDY